MDCREKADANFTCLDMLEAVQGEGCASACASDIKKNIADMYESGEFVSLCASKSERLLDWRYFIANHTEVVE